MPTQNTLTDTLPPTADVVIIGGGPAGTAALWALSRRAPDLKIVLLEKSDNLGAGSSLASLENFRTCWPSPCIAMQMRFSIGVFHNADEYLGEGAETAIALKQQGYLFCAFTESQAQTLKAEVAHLHNIKIAHVEYLDAGEIAYRFPWLRDRVIAAKFDPIAGWLDSNALIHQYARNKPNATLIRGAGDIQLCVESGHITGVTTSRGSISAPNVVIAAGAGSGAIAQSAGLKLPVIYIPRQSFTSEWRHEEFPRTAPMLIGAAPFPHVRPEASAGAIFGWEYQWRDKRPNRPADTLTDGLREPIFPLEPLKDPRFPSIALTLLARQFGHREGEGFANPRYLRGHHNIGYYVYRDESTAYVTDSGGNRQPYHSERAIIDAFPGVDGLFISIAHAGHGIMTSPASGDIIASKVLGQPLTFPSFSEFGINVAWAEHDENAL